MFRVNLSVCLSIVCVYAMSRQLGEMSEKAARSLWTLFNIILGVNMVRWRYVVYLRCKGYA